MEEADKGFDSQLWHACAGGMVQLPRVNSKVFYFPQGHAEHAQTKVDFTASLRIPALVLCRVAAVKFMADPESDEVFAHLKLVPLGHDELEFGDDDDDEFGTKRSESSEKPASFAKTLTQSDANNGGGFSVPRYCAETIFPQLDYSADPPVQSVIAKDVHDVAWKFRHIYRGTPRRHLLTTGWSNFVNQKKLVAGDSVVFLRAENGDLYVGIRRAKRGYGWNPGPSNLNSPFGGISMFLREENSCGNFSPGGNLEGRERVRPESVIKAATLAASGKPFEVVYYPRAGTPEFCVKASTVRAAMRIYWNYDMRFKMAFKTEDSSRISWFMGTISSVQVADAIRWPNSPWRLLEVSWDEPDLVHNVKRISPWLVELIPSNIPVIPPSPFLSPRKKFRSFSGTSDNSPAGIQGARHAQFGRPLLNLGLSNRRLQIGLFPSSLQQFDIHSKISNSIITGHTNGDENLSCLLTIGNSMQNPEKSDNVKRHHFFLFGQPIVTEQKICRGCSNENLGKGSSDEILRRVKLHTDGSTSTLGQSASPEKSLSCGVSWHKGFQSTETGVTSYHCEVSVESEDVSRTLDLSIVGSYEELYRMLANMYGIERLEMLSHVLYRDANGSIKRTGDEPFSDFMRTAKRLTILTDSESNNIGRTWFAGMRRAEKGLDASNKAGSLGIFA